MSGFNQISVEEQGRSLVIKIDREAVMKIAVNGDLFTLKKGMHELNLTVGGVPFKEDSLVNKVCVFFFLMYTPQRDFHTFPNCCDFIRSSGEPSSWRLYEGVALANGWRHLHTRNHQV